MQIRSLCSNIIHRCNKNNIRNDIISFIDHHPTFLQSEPLESKPWASPRSWSYLSAAMDEFEMSHGNSLFYSEIIQLASGHIGIEYATKFCEYVQLFNMWDVTAYLNKTIPIPEFETGSDILKAYTFMSAMIGGYMKRLREDNYDTEHESIRSYTSVIKEMFIKLQSSHIAIIPLGLRTIIVDESAKSVTAKVYSMLIKDNPMLLESVKTVMGLNNK